VRRLLFTFVLASLTFAAPASAGGNLRAFVAAEDDATLIAVDLNSRRVLRRIPVAPGPHNVATSSDGRFVLVTSPPAGRVTLVSARSLRVLAVFRGFGYPHDVKVVPNGRYAYVTDEEQDRVVVLDLLRRRVVRRVAAGRGPHDLAVSPDGRRTWVTHGRTPRGVLVLSSAQPTRPIPLGNRRVGAGPHDLVFSPDGERVWLTYWGSGRVGVADLSSAGVRRFAAGTEPHHVYVGRDVVWVTDNEGARAALFDTQSLRRLRTVRVGPSPHHVAGFGPLIVVASHDGGTISAHRPLGRRLFTVRVGAGPHGIALALVP